MCLTVRNSAAYLGIYAFYASKATSCVRRFPSHFHTVKLAIAQTGVESVEGAFELRIHTAKYTATQNV